MKKYLKIFIITFFVFSFSQVSANENWVFSDGKTIKELKKEIENFEKMNLELDSSLKKFLQENKIDSFLKKWLTSDEISNIKNIVNSYISKNSNLENILKKSKNEQEIEKLNLNLLDLKRDLYKWLVPYIDSKNYKNYLTFIDNNLKNFLEKNSLYLNKIKTQSNYEKKVEILEKKIQENKQNLDNQLKNIVEQKVWEKLDDFLSSPSFSKLPKEEKQKILSKIYTNLKTQSDILQSKIDLNSAFVQADLKKLEIYKIFIWKINELSLNLK